MGGLALRRSLSKTHLRVVAVDDGAFSRRQRSAPIAAVVWSSPDRVEGVAVGRVEVDGTDATTRVAELVRTLPAWDGVRAVLLDGIAVGGFNVIDLRALARRLGRPVIAVTRRRPDLPAMRSALFRYFPDARRRWAVLTRVPLEEVPTRAQPIFAAAAGCESADARALVRRAAVVGVWPEPLRLAHLVARAVGVARASRARTGPTLKRRVPVSSSAGL